MPDILIWVIAGVCLIALIVVLTAPEAAAPLPAYEIAVPQPTFGPHVIMARGMVDAGHFVLVRTPLYEFPFNSILVTQVIFDAAGAMLHARYCRVETLTHGLVDVGVRHGRPVHVRVGTGTDCQVFPVKPEAIWTH